MMKKYFLIISVFAILIILAIVLALNSKKKTQDVYKTVVFPNNPWKYQVINKSNNLDQNKWLQGYGTIGEGIDTLIIQAEDTLICTSNFIVEDINIIRALEVKLLYEANCQVYINDELCCEKEYEDYNLKELTARLDSIKDLRNKYLKFINYSKLIPKDKFSSLLKEGKNELVLKFYNSRPSGKEIRSYVTLRTLSKKGIKISKSESYKKFKFTELPVIKIYTVDNILPDSITRIAKMGIINGPTRKNNINGPYNEYDGFVKVETRGNTSRMFPKKSFNITTIGVDRKSKVNCSLLGMPAENDWVLYASYNDRSMIRNALIYKISNDIGLYAPRTKFCELFINEDYQGVYLLTEKIKCDKNRVNINKIKQSDTAQSLITGGYIVSIERHGDWHSPFRDPRTAGIIIYEYRYPKIENMNQCQINYIGNYLKDFEGSIYFSNNDVSDTSYLKYIDESSFVDFYILNELARNVDGLRLSTYFSKDRNGKLKAGPIWDFDLSFGLPCYSRGYWFQGSILENNFYLPFWWIDLVQNPHFNNAVAKRWKELRISNLSYVMIDKTIGSLLNDVSNAQQRNFEKWNTLEYNVWPNYYNESTYNEQVDYIKFWIKQRINWLDHYFAEY